MSTDAEVAAKYDELRALIVDALNTHPAFHDAEWSTPHALGVFSDTEMGNAFVFFPSVVMGGLMSDRVRALAMAHAERLADEIRARGGVSDV